jgi:hypothetical protein
MPKMDFEIICIWELNQILILKYDALSTELLIIKSLTAPFFHEHKIPDFLSCIFEMFLLDFRIKTKPRMILAP